MQIYLYILNLLVMCEDCQPTFNSSNVYNLNISQTATPHVVVLKDFS